MTVPTSGTVIVRSNPSGAEIWLNGQKQEQRTPAELKELPLDIPFRVAVRQDEMASVPKEHEVLLTPTSRKQTIEFRFVAARRFTIETKPPGASVTIDGFPAGNAPVSTEPIALGQTATVSVTLAKHKPKIVVLRSSEDAPDTIRIELKGR